MKSEWADYAAVQAYCGNLSGNELTRNLSGNIRPLSSQLAEPLWTDPGSMSHSFADDTQMRNSSSLDQLDTTI